MSVRTKKAEDRIDRRDVTRTALILAGLFWLILLYPTNFDAAMSEKLRRVLGERPGGLSYDLYILLFTLQLSVPMAFFFYHLLITRTYARKRQRAVAHVGDAGRAPAFLDISGIWSGMPGRGRRYGGRSSLPLPAFFI